jgi:hypothetical protein
MTARRQIQGFSDHANAFTYKLRAKRHRYGHTAHSYSTFTSSTCSYILSTMASAALRSSSMLVTPFARSTMAYQPLLARIPLVVTQQAIPKTLARPTLAVFSTRLHSFQASSLRLSPYTRLHSTLFARNASTTSSSSPPPPSSSSSSSSSSNADDRYGDLPKDASLSEKLKHLIKKYGWYALGVYLVAGAVDFGFVFLAINIFGADKVSAITTAAKDTVKGWLGRNSEEAKQLEEGHDEVKKLEKDATKEQKGSKEGLYATAALAYIIHKTLFLPFRLGVCAAVTPKLVKMLRAKGWVGQEGARQAGREMRQKAQDMRQRARKKVDDKASP